MSVCFYCRNATDCLWGGKVCCEECGEETRCSGCMMPFAKHKLEFFGPDGICERCLPEIVEELLSDDDPDYVLPDDEAHSA
jgi:hypothetical protein